MIGVNMSGLPYLAPMVSLDSSLLDLYSVSRFSAVAMGYHCSVVISATIVTTTTPLPGFVNQKRGPPEITAASVKSATFKHDVHSCSVETHFEDMSELINLTIS